MKKASIRRRLAAILACALAAAIVVSGAYAVTLLSQFDTNEFAGLGLRYDATLNEEFMEEGNWKEGQTVPKLISVTNTGLDNGNFGDVYVHLQLKEYMEFYEIEYKYWNAAGEKVSGDDNPALFMTTVVGDGTSLETGKPTYVIITGKNTLNLSQIKKAAGDQYPGLKDLDPNIFEKDSEGNDRVFVYLTDAVSGLSGWFVQTRAGDINGQYGKWVVAEFAANKDDFQPVDTDVSKSHEHDYGEYDEHFECDYTTYIMEPGMTGYEKTALFRKWVAWTFGPNVKPLSEWDGIEQVWLYDDEATAEEDLGWFYWSHPLTPDEDHATLKKTTDILLESITLTKQPKDDFYYAIHVDMNSAPQDGIWDNTPEELKEAWEEEPETPVRPRFRVTPTGNRTVAPGGVLEFKSYLGAGTGDDKTGATHWELSNIAPMSASGYTIAPLSVGPNFDGWSLEEVPDSADTVKLVVTASEDAENDDVLYLYAKYSDYERVPIKITVEEAAVDTGDTLTIDPEWGTPPTWVNDDSLEEYDDGVLIYADIAGDDTTWEIYGSPTTIPGRVDGYLRIKLNDLFVEQGLTAADVTAVITEFEGGAQTDPTKKATAAIEGNELVVGYVPTKGEIDAAGREPVDQKPLFKPTMTVKLQRIKDDEGNDIIGVPVYFDLQLVFWGL